MSIAEKLVTVAENEQKVNNAAYDRGKQIARLILQRTITEFDDDQITVMGYGAFYFCSGLERISLPALTHISGYAFYGCSALSFADLGKTSAIDSSAFTGCIVLKTLVIRNTESICTISSTAVFRGTPFINSGTGAKIYVPEALIESYQADGKWSALYCDFLPIEGSEYE